MIDNNDDDNDNNNQYKNKNNNSNNSNKVKQHQSIQWHQSQHQQPQHGKIIATSVSNNIDQPPPQQNDGSMMTPSTTIIHATSTNSISTPTTTMASNTNINIQKHNSLKQPQQKHNQMPQWRDAVAGACSGAISRTAMAPIERIKLLKQLQGSMKTGTSTSITSISSWDIMKMIYNEQGIISFWRGNLQNVLRVAGSSAINFTCMDYYKNAAVIPWLEQNFVLKQRMTTTTISNQQQQYQQQQQQDIIEKKRKLLSSFISGGLTGATTTTILYPIEFVRTRLAMDMGGTILYPKRDYNGMYDVIQSIYNSDKILGFYQGYGIALTGGIFYRILLLGGYDAIKIELLFRKENNNNTNNTINNNNKIIQLSWMERIISAQCISLLAGTLSYPFDSVRRRMMMEAGRGLERKYKNSIHCIQQMYYIEGIRGFFLGIGPNIIRSIGGTLLLVGYDTIRIML